MEREILYRGKDELTKEWRYGYLLSKNVIGEVIFENGTYTVKCTSVIPETVGQYIGLKDMKFAKIFEGDVLRWGMNNQEAWIRCAKVVVNPDIKFEITHYIHGKTKEVKKSDGKIFKYGNFLYDKTEHYVEIIGNIHE